jgi:epoxyqueuosine reductase
MNLRESIRSYALSLGFDSVGFANPEGFSLRHSDGLESFLHEGHHGDMGWMQARAELRKHPSQLWPEVKSILALGHNYAPTENPLEALDRKNEGVISCYAKGDDYHDVIKKKLKALAQWLVQEHGGEVKVFVDTAPVMEKPLAEQAGIGWQGKHTCIVSREFGSWLFLGEIFTTLDIEPDAPEVDHCGSCRACLDICPTNAFVDARKLDARRCISYLTIEHKGHIPREFRRAISNRIYGCDDCLAVCPWNKFAQSASEAVYQARDALKSPQLGDLLQLDDAEFRVLFAKSPIKRIGRDRFIRNVLIAVGNSNNDAYLPIILSLLKDESALVRTAAVWALLHISPLEFSKQRTIYRESEKDADVLSEWNC